MIFGVGSVSGTTIDLGDSCNIVPVYNSKQVDNVSSKTIPIGGNEITQQLVSLLQNKGSTFTTQQELDNIKKIKETFCYTSLDPKTEMQKIKPIKHELPDGRILQLEEELFQTPEILFSEAKLHEVITNVIQECPSNLSKELLGNIVIGGGSSLFKGFIERLEKELKTANPSSIATQNLYKDQSSYLNLLPNPIFSQMINYVPSVHINPIHSADITWKGGSIISGVSTFCKIGISKLMYQEFGPSIGQKKE